MLFANANVHFKLMIISSLYILLIFSFMEEYNLRPNALSLFNFGFSFFLKTLYCCSKCGLLLSTNYPWTICDLLVMQGSWSLFTFVFNSIYMWLSSLCPAFNFLFVLWALVYPVTCFPLALFHFYFRSFIGTYIFYLQFVVYSSAVEIV